MIGGVEADTAKSSHHHRRSRMPRTWSALVTATLTSALVLSVNPAVGTAQTLVPGTSSPATSTSEVPSFTDVSVRHPFHRHITWLATTGVTTGYPDGTFRPGRHVSRDAMAAFLYRYAGSPTFTPPAESPFTDVRVSHPFYKEITWLADQGITTGYDDGTFRPAAGVARGAMAAFLYRYAGSPPAARLPASFTDVPTGASFRTEILWLARESVSTGYPDRTFRPAALVTREAMAAFLFRFAGRGGFERSTPGWSTAWR
jgi:hypothetical protein